MKATARNVLLSTLVLAGFGLVGTGMVAWIESVTEARILENERAVLLASLNEIVPPGRYDNNPILDTVKVTSPELGAGKHKPVTVFIARKNGQPVAAIFNVIAPNGYGGPIKLLVGINADGTIAGVRVVSENETPGLGDAIKTSVSDWIYGFTGKSLNNPGAKGWAVQKDGGIFDQFTGATITPRAVVGAVHKTLLYFAAHRDEIFKQKPEPEHG
ncbi:MAG: electron transport complex subunit RsxG [Gammaproteobacteria bacterium]|jgi:electron transport complex protein RnfG